MQGVSLVGRTDQTIRLKGCSVDPQALQVPWLLPNHLEFESVYPFRLSRGPIGGGLERKRWALATLSPRCHDS